MQSKLKENQIFIHIPKTGGTTIIHAIYGKGLGQATNLNYRHIVGKTMLSNAGDIFNPLKNDFYASYKIFMMLRHPLDRLISEYYFFKEREAFTEMIKPFPKSFEEYALHPLTANYMISFLLGNRIYDKNRPNKDDLALVMNTIKSLNICVGINEYFFKSLNLFTSSVDLDLPKKIENKRVTIKRPRVDEISNQLKAKILQRNSLDMALYEFALERFEKEVVLANRNFQINDNRYEFVLSYTKNHFLLDLFIKDHLFIARNKDYFNHLRNYLHDLQIESGEKYLELWKEAFIKALKSTQLNRELDLFLKNSETMQALDFLEKFSLIIQRTNASDLNKIMLNFSRDHVPNPSWLSKIASFFSR